MPVAFTLLFLFLSVTLLPEQMRGQGDAFLQEKGKGEVWLSIGGGSTRSLYNTEGTLRPFDTLKTTFSAYTLGLSLDYGLMDDLEVNVALPIGRYSLSSAGRFRDRSIVAPAYLGVGATYRLINQSILTSVSAQVRIPPGFHDGIYDDPGHPTFLSDGYLQFLTTLNLAYATENVWTKGSVGYNVRWEEPVDELTYSAQIGFSRISGTGIFLGIDGVVATEDASSPTRPFYTGSSAIDSTEGSRLDGGIGRLATIERENTLYVSPGAFLTFNMGLTVSAQYRVSLYGVNTLPLNGLYLAAGYRF